MNQRELDPGVLSFIRDHIDSLVDLELIMLFRRNPAREWTAVEVAHELRIEPEWTQGRLARLYSNGIFARRNADNPKYYYAPSVPGLDEAAAGLARAYAERRVMVIHLIYTK